MSAESAHRRRPLGDLIAVYKKLSGVLDLDPSLIFYCVSEVVLLQFCFVVVSAFEESRPFQYES